ARREFAALMKSNCEHTGLQEAEAEEWTEFASDSDMGRYVDYAGRCDLLDQARSSLVKAGADKKGSPPGRRLYALARYLERTGQGNSSLARQVAELRTPARLSKAEQAALQPLLTESFMRQLRTTEVGREVAAYFDSGKKLDLRLGNMAGAWAYYDPSTDAITLSAAALSSYMRVNGYTLKDMLSDQRARDAYAAFFAPTLLHEAIHQMQHSWAAANGLPDVYLKSLEEETFAKQSLYVLQRMKNDPEYEKMLRISKRYSFYVQDLLSGTDQLRASPQNLMMSVDALYDSVPALPGGRAETIAELNRELKRRARMPQAEQQTLEEKGLPYEPAMQKYAYDRKGPLPYMKTSVLEALRSALVTKKDLLEANAQGVMEYVLAKLKELSGEETAPKEETDEYCVVY
ncbi:MAG TPA: hypothetical protein PLL10_02400, partial [Elusimicrobiales bacterium]|nr:hypothetical protein [Elusimicrobiales bacterium]